MRPLVLTACFLAAFFSLAHAQQSLDPLRVWADAGSYNYVQDPAKSYVEIYCAIQRSEFQFEDKEGRFEAAAFLYAEAFNESGVLVDSISRFVVMSITVLEDAYKKDIRIFEVLPMLLSPGKYKMKITAVDPISKRSGIATFETMIKDFSSADFSMSDIELAYDILPIDTAEVGRSSLIKANRRVLPNPNGYYSNEDSMAYYFAEVYNIAPKGKMGELEVRAVLNDAFGFPTREYAVRHHRKPGESAVISDAVPINGIPGGLYELQINIEDKDTGAKTKASKRFRVIYDFEQLSPTMADSTAFTESDAALMEQVIKYISTNEEKDLYRELDLPGKRAFLAQFWDRKNPRPGSPINEYKNEVFRRFAYANQYYSTSVATKTDGWKTDRGRVYMTYGHPDDVERVPSSMGQKPYEVWQYDRIPGQSGGDICVFVDVDGYGNYRLVHSTIRGEISDPSWESAIAN